MYSPFKFSMIHQGELLCLERVVGLGVDVGLVQEEGLSSSKQTFLL